MRGEIASLRFEVDTLKAVLRRESARDLKAEISVLNADVARLRGALSYCYEMARSRREAYRSRRAQREVYL